MTSRLPGLITLLFGFAHGCGTSAGGLADDETAATDAPDDDGDGTDGTSGEDPSGSDSSADDSGGSESTGGDVAPTGPYVDGERLRAIVQRSPSGTEAFDRWFDTERDHDCFFGHVGGGEYRCLPRSFAAQNMFADPGCTEPAGAEQCDSADVVTRFSGLACAGAIGEYGVWDVGAPVSTIYLQTSSGECAETDIAGYRLEPHAVEDFVAASATWADFGPLSRQEILAEDGTRQWSGPYLADSRVSCETRQVDGSGRCVTYNRGFVARDLHTDASCTGNDVIRVTADPGCIQPQVAVDGETVLGIGASLAGQTIYGGTGPQSCSESSADTSGLHRASSLDASAFPEARIELQGDGRLRHRIPVSPDGDQLGLAYPRWRDIELGFDCIPVATGGGSTVCAPASSASQSDWFADATCTQPLLRQTGLRPGWYARFDVGDACDGSTLLEAARVEQPYGGPVWRLSSGACEPVDDPEALGDLFEPVQRADPSALAIIEFD